MSICIYPSGESAVTFDSSKKGKARSEDGINRSVPSRLRTNPCPGRDPTRRFSFRERKEMR